MWRVCVKSMEKQVTAIDLIKTYHDRQVVLNYYDEDDFLHRRDGLFFDTVEIDNQFISFMKEGKAAYQISLEKYPEYKVLNDFNHHYLFYNETHHVDVYFPY